MGIVSCSFENKTIIEKSADETSVFLGEAVLEMKINPSLTRSMKIYHDLEPNSEYEVTDFTVYLNEEKEWLNSLNDVEITKCKYNIKTHGFGVWFYDENNDGEIGGSRSTFFRGWFLFDKRQTIFHDVSVGLWWTVLVLVSCALGFLSE